MCIVFHEIFVSFFFLDPFVFDWNVKCCYGCEGFTHPLRREEKSRVKGLINLGI